MPTQMQDKEMVNDLLSMINSSLTGYSNVISQSSNQQFRQTMQEIRNSSEQFQYQLYQMAEQKNFYQAASPADQSDIQTVKSQLGQ